MLLAKDYKCKYLPIFDCLFVNYSIAFFANMCHIYHSISHILIACCALDFNFHVLLIIFISHYFLQVCQFHFEMF